MLAPKQKKKQQSLSKPCFGALEHFVHINLENRRIEGQPAKSATSETEMHPFRVRSHPPNQTFYAVRSTSSESPGGQACRSSRGGESRPAGESTRCIFYMGTALCRDGQRCDLQTPRLLIFAHWSITWAKARVHLRLNLREKCSAHREHAYLSSLLRWSISARRRASIATGPAMMKSESKYIAFNSASGHLMSIPSKGVYKSDLPEMSEKSRVSMSLTSANSCFISSSECCPSNVPLS